MKLSHLFITLCLSTVPLIATATEFKGRGAALTIDLIEGRCSGTSVGEYTILTATHCFAPATDPEGPPNTSAPIRVNGKVMTITNVVHDGKDHILIIMDQAFKTWAPIAAPATQGDRIHFWGNPGGLTMILREGLVIGSEGPVDIIDAQGWKGDSGSGVFNHRGEVVGVVSAINADIDPNWPGASFQVVLMSPLAFTPEQLALIK